MKSQALLARALRSLRTSGEAFTLPEVLLAGIIAAAVVVITAQVMVGQLLEERRLEVAQRFRENVSRLNYLIQIEASETEEIDLSGTSPPTGCPAGAAFTFLIHPPVGTYQDDANRRLVQYYNADSDGQPSIWRCGPRVRRNGVLNFDDATNEPGVVLRNARLTVSPTGCQTSTERSVTYTVTPTAGLAGAGLGQLGGCTTAQARSYFVCNPPVAGVTDIGDCPP
jgi:hypothetical protein